jgi:hypothetical protein
MHSCHTTQNKTYAYNETWYPHLTTRMYIVRAHHCTSKSQVALNVSALSNETNHPRHNVAKPIPIHKINVFSLKTSTTVISYVRVRRFTSYDVKIQISPSRIDILKHVNYFYDSYDVQDSWRSVRRVRSVMMQSPCVLVNIRQGRAHLLNVTLSWKPSGQDLKGTRRWTRLQLWTMMLEDNERLIINMWLQPAGSTCRQERRAIGPHDTHSLASRGGDNAANWPTAFTLFTG